MLKLEASRERGLRDLELLRGRLLGGEPVLQLVAGPGEGAGEPVLRIADHPAEQLGRDSDRADLCCGAGGAAQVLGRAGGERAADGRADQQRADDVRSTALVLLRSGLAVLVASDRDVLRTVIGGDL